LSLVGAVSLGSLGHVLLVDLVLLVPLLLELVADRLTELLGRRAILPQGTMRGQPLIVEGAELGRTVDLEPLLGRS
jgi:hypothetical protein